MGHHPCYRLFPNIKQPIPHLLSVIPVRPSFQSSHTVLPVGQSHLRGKRNMLAAGPDFCSIQSSLDTKQRCSQVETFFEVEMIVQDCEVDKYGVVANTVYADYIDKGREEFARIILGINTDLIAESGRALATSELNLKYFVPMRGGEKFAVKSRIAKIKGVRIFLEHVIETLPDRNVILKGVTTVVCLNEDYRPTRVFPEISNKLQRYLSSDENDNLS